jgi:antitoxin (DNA-binding transcriptional repressor) of toxin-antitoxin stability system
MDLSRLIAEVIPGGEVVISRRVVLPVRLVSVSVPGTRRFGALYRKIVIDARFDEPLPDAGVAAWHGK